MLFKDYRLDPEEYLEEFKKGSELIYSDRYCWENNVGFKVYYYAGYEFYQN